MEQDAAQKESERARYQRKIFGMAGSLMNNAREESTKGIPGFILKIKETDIYFRGCKFDDLVIIAVQKVLPSNNGLKLNHYSMFEFDLGIDPENPNVQKSLIVESTPDGLNSYIEQCNLTNLVLEDEKPEPSFELMCDLYRRLTDIFETSTTTPLQVKNLALVKDGLGEIVAVKLRHSPISTNS